MPVPPNGLWVKRSSKAQLSWLNIEFRAAVHAVWLAPSPATGLSRKTHLTRIYSSVGSHLCIEISNSGNDTGEIVTRLKKCASRYVSSVRLQNRDHEEFAVPIAADTVASC
jgi:hypothetical protein